ncbi:RyR domain-containing protein [Nocardiopsis sp. YSL2]|uniref:RyR domain-containing protein n=1 Tax=Nocardiopsis sp. YSL2 TaxID=2939492 RepID=UPI0026F451B1|nr:RyR domain-containing protein [Nocardiopsis sp. YSL2]
MDHAGIARVCYDANRAYQVVTGDPAVSPPWDEAPEWQHESALVGVEQALDGATPAQLHESWCAHKRFDGWKYGPIKSFEDRTHPCLVPYEELPEDQRRKDALFHAIVAALR